MGTFLTIVGWILLAAQGMSYLGNRGPSAPVSPPPPTNIYAYLWDIAYFIGYNLPLILGLVLLVIGHKIKKKNQNDEENNDDDE